MFLIAAHCGLIKCSCAGDNANLRQMHVATDAYLAMLDSTLHSLAAPMLHRSPADFWHVSITRAQTEAAKPDSLEWLITFLNMSACVARICSVETSAGPAQLQPKPFGAAILERNTLEVVFNSVLQAVEVTRPVIIKHQSRMLVLPNF